MRRRRPPNKLAITTAIAMLLLSFMACSPTEETRDQGADEVAFMEFILNYGSAGIMQGNLTKYRVNSISKGTYAYYDITTDNNQLIVQPYSGEKPLGTPFYPSSTGATYDIRCSYNDSANEIFRFSLQLEGLLTHVMYKDCEQFVMEEARSEITPVDVQPCRFNTSAELAWTLCPDNPTPSKQSVAVCQPPTTTTVSPPSDNTWSVVVGAGVSMVGVVIIVGIIVYFRYRRRRAQDKIAMELKILEHERSHGHNSVSGSHTHPRKRNPTIIAKESFRYALFPERIDEWEVDRRHIDMDYTRKLGHGAFGSVYFGKLIGIDVTERAAHTVVEISVLRIANHAVAIKMLADHADDLARREFLAEIALMKNIPYHERLVNLIGCVTESIPRLLIMEYCEHGDLLKYLIKRRAYMIELQSKSLPITETPDETMIITPKQQLMFTLQVVYGLEFLSQMGYVHRDIAARNILVDERRACKIGDFGLCRHVDDAHDIYLSRGGRLPLKWMPPEAIKDYEFSTKSDVWSFAVLFFEIITLGGSPYPDWAAHEVLQRLLRGERMEQPDNCSNEMYTLMRDCWEANPTNRPNFSEVRKRIAERLEEITMDDFYLRLDAQKNYYQDVHEEPRQSVDFSMMIIENQSCFEDIAEC